MILAKPRLSRVNRRVDYGDLSRTASTCARATPQLHELIGALDIECRPPRQADLARLCRRVPRAPAAEHQAAAQHEPLHRHELVRLAGRLLTPEGPGELPAPGVPDGH